MKLLDINGKYKKLIPLLVIAAIATEIFVRLLAIAAWDFVVSKDINLFLFGTNELGFLKGSAIFFLLLVFRIDKPLLLTK